MHLPLTLGAIIAPISRHSIGSQQSLHWPWLGSSSLTRSILHSAETTLAWPHWWDWGQCLSVVERIVSMLLFTCCKHAMALYRRSDEFTPAFSHSYNSCFTTVTTVYAITFHTKTYQFVIQVQSLKYKNHTLNREVVPAFRTLPTRFLCPNTQINPPQMSAFTGHNYNLPEKWIWVSVISISLYRLGPCYWA